MPESLLEGEDDPVLLVNGSGRSPYVLIAEHASNRLPKKLGTLGLAESDLERHIAWDIGAERVARRLSQPDRRAPRAAALLASRLRLQPAARRARRHARDQRDHPYSRQPESVARRQAGPHSRDLPPVPRRHRRPARRAIGGRDSVAGGDDSQLHAGLQGPAPQRRARHPPRPGHETRGEAHHELSRRGCAIQRALRPRGRRAAHAQCARRAPPPRARHDRDSQRSRVGRTWTTAVGGSGCAPRSRRQSRTSQGEARWPPEC